MKTLLAVCVLMCCLSAGAEPFDWQGAESGVHYRQSVAFAGCAKAETLSDLRARKVAILKAQANITRTRFVAVSGEEHLATGGPGDGHYRATVIETSASFMPQIMVVKEDVAFFENARHLCVLVAEINN